MKLISPSLLAANFNNLQKDIMRVENAGAERLHLDIMDGHFVPNLTFGPFIIDFIRQSSTCHLESHLMIENPAASFDQYIKSGSDTIIFHLESTDDPIGDLKYLNRKNILAGIALNPDTDIKLIIPLLDYMDYLLIMSVYPGSGGQSFIPETLYKMEEAVSLREDRNITIGVDGGVNLETIRRVYETGIDVTVVGSGLFNSNNIPQQFKKLMDA